MAELTYTFDELPLAIIDDRECVMVSGEVDVEYSSPVDWHITAIALDGWKLGSGFKPVTVQYTSLWYEVVRAAIVSRCKEGIRCAILDELDEIRESRHA